ncbi:DUF58 domain-containing protein [Vibrio europaeus]|uniref:DUF58 domain-containing protein n=1 Tax=Vibrio europaeus TaxID=300876 RepID=UPI00233E7E64|nr:DUF58 domain-containing protein [Vibrio europaeus]MDC5818424.1 DUF58 domain-containing protein [Vibrio europaeus]MDC5871573.1 DUF58 domain-containing protein [Vibrio europaeus]
MHNALPPFSDGVNLTLDELLYYKQQCVKWLPPAKSLWSQMLGQHQSRQLGRGMDFSEVRQYQAGDDIRAIDWRVTARTGKPHTKLFSEEREKPIMLYLDLSASMLFGSTLMLKSVQMAHMASLIAWLSVSQQDRVGAVIDTGHQLIELKPTSRNKGALALTQSLVSLHQQLLSAKKESDYDVSHALQSLARVCPKGSEIILLSDFSRFTQTHESKLSRLSQHNRVRMIQIYDPLERGQTAYRGTEQVSNKQQTRWLDFSSNKTRLGIEQAFEQQQTQLQQMALRMGISFSSLSSDAALTQQLHGF